LFIYLLPLEILFPASSEHNRQSRLVLDSRYPDGEGGNAIIRPMSAVDWQTPANRSLALSWSGGKDSALALLALRQAGTEPVALLTTFTEDFDRVSMHAVRRELARAQAREAGIPLVEVEIPASCPNATYEQRMAATLGAPPLDGVGAIAFADLFLEEIRAYRVERMARAGREALFPVWGRETAELAREFIAAGFEATLVCVDPAQLHPSFVGRRFDEALLADLPAGVDPCGENGEFHTFVHAGPIFARPIPIELGEAVTRDGFAFQDVLPARSAAAPA
jgi:uncharacterized protein (TIGR00290 family)